MGYSEKRQVHVTIMGEDTICTLEKAQSSNDKESTGYKVKTRIYVGDSVYENSKEFDSMEFLIIDLQKRLPESVVLACCQTCQHGNFCPFGDNEDEIFCLHGYSPESKGDVVGII